MSAPEYRQDDVIGRGYCPRCHRSMSVDTALFGYCPEHGRVPADFARPTGWRDPDLDGYEPSDPKSDGFHGRMADVWDMRERG